MSLANILSLLFGSGVVVSLCRYFLKRLKETDEKNKSIQLGVQALLRDRLIKEYNKALERGYAPIYAKDNFENMWLQYHNLGKNGVMDEIRAEYMAFPTEKEE